MCRESEVNQCMLLAAIVIEGLKIPAEIYEKSKVHNATTQSCPLRCVIASVVQDYGTRDRMKWAAFMQLWCVVRDRRLRRSAVHRALTEVGALNFKGAKREDRKGSKGGQVPPSR